jgi:hypothetical protein
MPLRTSVPKPSDGEPFSRESAAQAAAFAAVEAIMAGEWDLYLARVRGALVRRTQTDEYQATLVAGRDARRPS